MGDISVLVRTDLLLYSLVLDLVLLIYMKRHAEKDSYSSKLYFWSILVITFVTLVETISWLSGEIGNSAQIPLHYWSNAVFLALMGFPAAFGLSYLDYKIFRNEEKTRKRLLIYLIPTYIGIAFSIYNIFDEGFFFYIADTNQYYRGIGVTISVAIIYSFFITAMAFFLRNKKMITGRTASSMIIFCFVPVLGSLIQTLAYGTTFGMPSYTLAAFIIFLILERDEMGKDEMTGLYTRFKMESRLRFKLKSNDAFMLIMADLNDFKEINDTYGHAEGDKALKAVANVLKQVINPEDMVCRYGGDEFLLLIEFSEDICEKVIARIDRSMAKCSPSTEYNLSLSYGYEFIRYPSGVSLDELLKRIDKRMYQNKEERKIKTA